MERKIKGSVAQFCLDTLDRYEAEHFHSRRRVINQIMKETSLAHQSVYDIIRESRSIGREILEAIKHDPRLDRRGFIVKLYRQAKTYEDRIKFIENYIHKLERKRRFGTKPIALKTDRAKRSTAANV